MAEGRDRSVLQQAIAPETENRNLHLIYMPPRSVQQRQPEELHGVSPWTQSFGKRLFDVALVLASLPLLLPLLAVIAIAVRLTSRGRVLFLQKRIGREAKPFTIIKFRTMIHSEAIANGSITTINNQRITYVGRILRHWKLDELPQLFNVLRGDMSLVGPRPKVPEQQMGCLKCRPGVTGAASVAFAREEVLLASVPKRQLDAFYRDVVLPLKRRLDDGYMAGATFVSDLNLILKTVFRLWDSNGLQVSGNRLREVQIATPHDCNDYESGKCEVVSRAEVSNCSGKGTSRFRNL